VRLAGTVDNELHATAFRDVLFNRGIECDVEQASSGQWSVWVHDEDRLADVTSLLLTFNARPDDPVYAAEADRGSDRRRAAEKVQAKAHRESQRETVLAGYRSLGIGPVTLSLMGVSVLLTVLLNTPYADDVARALLMHYPSVQSGQVWRLFTPIFLHFGVLHILFNMLWLKDLGSMMETIRGRLFFCLFVAIAAGLSNAAQYAMSGPGFGGMSGVVYAMLGYAWLQSRLNPWSGFVMHSFTMQMMMVWFVLGLSGLVGNIANGTHAVGLMVGLAWGYLDARRRSS